MREEEETTTKTSTTTTTTTSSRRRERGASLVASTSSRRGRRHRAALAVATATALLGKGANADNNNNKNKNKNNIKEPLTDETFRDAIDKCMRTNPVDGLCHDLPKYGAMPTWDTSKVTNMDEAFVGGGGSTTKTTSGAATPVKFTEFNADLSNWDVSSVTSMRDMFSNCRDFEGVGLEKWNTERVETMAGIFRNCQTFATDITGWKGKATETPMKDAVKGASAFQRAFVCVRDPMKGVTFNTCTPNESMESNLGEDEEDEEENEEEKDKQPLTDETFQNAIEECLKTNPIGGMCRGSEYGIMPDWDVSRVTDMSKAFYDKWDFNGDLSKWDVKNLKNAQEMFYGADAFNADVSKWNTQNLENCQDMFHDAKSFNRSIDHWKTHKVTNMNGMFMGATNFNSDISNWDVQNVESMRDMFAETSSFNQPIGKWNVKSCRDMRFMFSKARTFKQRINNWKGPAAKEAQFKMFSDAYSFLGKFRCEEQEHGPAQSCTQREVYNSNAAAALGEARGTAGALGEADVHLASGAMFRHNPVKEAVALLSLTTIALIGFLYTTKEKNSNYKTNKVTPNLYATEDEESHGLL
jgi:surface protein